MPNKMNRAAYAQMFGPTVGDKVRLADTDIIIEVEKDYTVYGEEVKFGGGKSQRNPERRFAWEFEAAGHFFLARKRKARGHHADHGVGCAIQFQGAAENSGIGAEMFAP